MKTHFTPDHHITVLRYEHCLQIVGFQCTNKCTEFVLNLVSTDGTLTKTPTITVSLHLTFMQLPRTRNM